MGTCGVISVGISIYMCPSGVDGSVRDTLYVKDDVSLRFLWTAALSLQESVKIGAKKEGGVPGANGTQEGLFLWVTVLLVLSLLVPPIGNQTREGGIAFYSSSLQLFLLPLFHSAFILNLEEPLLSFSYCNSRNNFLNGCFPYELPLNEFATKHLQVFH